MLFVYCCNQYIPINGCIFIYLVKGKSCLTTDLCLIYDLVILTSILNNNNNTDNDTESKS